MRHAREFLEQVHAYTTVRTTAEVLEDSAQFRVPSGPVLNGETVTSFEQFAARAVFERVGAVVEPRVPYRISGPPAGGDVPLCPPLPSARLRAGPAPKFHRYECERCW